MEEITAQTELQVDFDEIKLTSDYVFALDGCVVSYNDHYYKVITNNNELKHIFKGSVVTVYENILNHKIFVKYYNKFYNTEIIPDKITASSKAKITRVENQKKLDQVLKYIDKAIA